MIIFNNKSQDKIELMPDKYKIKVYMSLDIKYAP